MSWSRSGVASSVALVFALLLGSSAAHATESLEVFLEHAKNQSFDAREAQITARQRDAEADASLGKLLPAFTARGTYTRNQEEVAIQNPAAPGSDPIVITPLNQLDASFLLEVPILDLASYHRYRAAKVLSKSAEIQTQATTLDVSRSVARAYYQFLGASSTVSSAEESIKAAQANLQQVEDRHSAGAATDLDRERARAAVSRAEQDLADQQLGVALAARSLETFSGMLPSSAGALPEDDLHAEGSLDRWLKLSSETPSQKVARQLEEAATENRKAAKRAYLPTLNGSAEERISNATGFGGRNTNYTLKLNLVWRLDYGLVGNDHAQSAALDLQKVRAERTRRSGEDAVFEAFKRVEASIAKSRAARDQERSAKRAAELASDRYGAGVATQLDVTEAQRDAFSASAARIQADSDLAYYRAALRIAAGVPVSDRRAP